MLKLSYCRFKKIITFTPYKSLILINYEKIIYFYCSIVIGFRA